MWIVRFWFTFASSVKSKINKKRKQENKAKNAPLAKRQAFFEMKIIYWKSSNGSSFEILKQQTESNTKTHPTQMEMYTTEKIQSIKVAHYNSTIADTFGRIQIALNEHSRADMPFTFFRISSQFTQFFFLLLSCLSHSHSQCVRLFLVLFLLS